MNSDLAESARPTHAALLWVASLGAVIVFSVFEPGLQHARLDIRLLQASCIALGMLFLVTQFTLREFAHVMLVATTWNLVSSIIVEIAAGTFRPELDGYRFAGILTPETQGIECALLVLSALTLVRRSTRNLHLLIGLIAFGILFLLLTKSLTSCSAFLMALTVTIVLQQNSYLKWMVGFGAICLLVPSIIETQELLQTTNWASLVGSESNGTSHLLGTCVLLPMAMFALWHAHRQFHLTRDEGYQFLIAQIVMALVVSLTSSYYITPSLGGAMCAASIARLMLTKRPLAAGR